VNRRASLLQAEVLLGFGYVMCDGAISGEVAIRVVMGQLSWASPHRIKICIPKPATKTSGKRSKFAEGEGEMSVKEIKTLIEWRKICSRPLKNFRQVQSAPMHFKQSRNLRLT
jgi:hypothetical protein